jgi:Tfp pilus assembly protein PilN
MITVDLLPESYKKERPSQIQQFHRSPLALLFIVILAGSWLLLTGFASFRQFRINRLTHKAKALSAKYSKAQSLKNSVEELQNQRSVFQKLEKDRTHWANRLSAISSITPDGIWLTELSYDPQKEFSVQGSAVGQRGQEMVSIGRFVQDFKSSPELASLSANLQIESIKTRQDKEVEVVEFNLLQELSPTSKNAAKGAKSTKRK